MRNQRASGNAEAALAARRNLRRQLGRERAAERDLALAAAELQRLRQREPELDDAVVEQRRAQLERMGHRRDVGLRQQVAGEVRLQVEPLQARDPGLRRRPEQEAGRREHADLLLRGVGPEIGAQRERQHLHQPSVALAARRGGGFEEARGSEDGRAPLAPSRRQRAQQPRSGGCGGSGNALGQTDRGVALVSGERLVASVADERDRHLAPRRLADQEERQRGLVAERLVERGREPRQRRRRVGLEHDLLVPRRVAIRHRARERPLVVAIVGEPDGERAHRLGRRVRHQRDDHGRVDPAREQRTERHVGHEPLPHRVGDRLAHALEPRLVRERLARDLRLPVALDPLRPALGHEQRGRRQAVDSTQPGALARDVLEREIRVERGEVRLAPQRRQLQQRLQLRRERERPVAEARPQQRLLAEPVAREHEPSARRVPQRDREHAVEPLDEARPVLLVQVRDHRRVAAAAHLVTLLREVGAELREVVQLAVEDGDDVALLVRHRLVAELRVEHLQPLMAEDARAERVRRALVGAAVADPRAHGVDELRRWPPRRRVESADPAHA